MAPLSKQSDVPLADSVTAVKCLSFALKPVLSIPGFNALQSEMYFQPDFLHRQVHFVSVCGSFTELPLKNIA
jgi:hypothetical protein